MIKWLPFYEKGGEFMRSIMVSAGIGLVFMWWGVRKAARTLLAAFRKGRVSI